MNQALRTAIQEVYFDLVDARDNQLFALSPEAELPQEFDTIGDWLDEQINKLERIEQLTKGNQ
jgi:hypothetical protein